MDINNISGEIVDSAIKIHKILGPGLLENAYEACMIHELESKGLDTESQVTLPIVYEDVKIDLGYRIDLLVNEKVIVELKSVEKVIPIYEAQILSYLKLSNIKLGLLINFNVTRMKDGIKRFANKL